MVFEPKRLKVGVSTAPWQLGEFVAYDLKKVFAMNGLQTDTRDLRQRADRYQQTASGKQRAVTENLMDFRALKAAVMDKQAVDVERLVADNPACYPYCLCAGG